MVFVTSTGSTYEVDLENKRIRRLSGEHDPTPRQGRDGDWRSYLEITPIEVNAPVGIFWDPKTTPKLQETQALEEQLGCDLGAAPATLTSPVRSIRS